MSFPSTLVDLLAARAAQRGDDRAYTFLSDIEGGADTVSYRELDARARAIGHAVARAVSPGSRALLLYPAGLDFIAAFFGAMYGGAVAVPAYPPDPVRLNRTLPRLQAVQADAGATIVLTTRAIARLAEGMFQAVPGLAALTWLATDDLALAGADRFTPPRATGDTLAMLQYTSGSTGSPRGVMLAHRNLLANQAMILQGFEHDERSSIAGWLPQYHDMGLIGNILHPLYCGVPAVLMSPQAFLARPMRWLETVAQHRATTSGGPNFAYELCVRKSTDDEIRRLDLSSWRVAFSGAEPVRPDTLRRFAERFAPAGFDARAFYPCYGLAEATLIVTGHRRATPTVVVDVDADALRRDAVAPASRPDATSSLVGNGRALGDSRVAIVDPATRRRCPAGQIGEVWVAGPSVALGYWANPGATRDTFEAQIDGEDGRYLRTGDLGFVGGEQLYLVGRLKDLIILRGRNHHPEDLEWTLEGVHPALRPGCCAAFSITGQAGEELAIVAELGKRVTTAAAEIFLAVREALAAHHEIQPDRIYLVGAGSVPKTSSGKIRRRATRDQLAAGELAVIASWSSLGQLRGGAARSAPASLPQLVADLLGLDETALDLDAPLTRYGIDSLTATELSWQAQHHLGLALPLGDLLGGATLRALADRPVAPPGAAPAPTRGERSLLSAGEHALWFLHHVAPDSPAYHVATALRVHGAFDERAFEAALEQVVRRHAALRTRYPARDGRPVAEPSPEPLDFAVVRDAAPLHDEARRPFDLARGPLFRVRVFAPPGAAPIVLLVLHHIVTDFWSLCVIADELIQIYQGILEGRRIELAPVASYDAHAAAQQAFLASPEGERALGYWRDALSPDVPALELPTDRPRPPAQTFRGASEPFELDARLSARLEALARSEGVTLYALLLAAYEVLLARHTGQHDFAIGVPTTGRQPPFQATAGYFVNLLPLRADLAGAATFRELAQRVQRRLVGALDHQAVPLPHIIERVQPARDASRSPIFQTVFVLQKASRLAEAGLSALALGEAGHRARLGQLEVETVALEQRSAQFDVTLLVAPGDGRLAGACEYNTDLFDRARIARLLGHYEALLRWIVEHPGAALDDAELLTAPERAQLLGAWSAPGPVVTPHPLHALVEHQVDRTPGAIAVERDARQLTYRELDARANQLAHRLRRLGVAGEVRVGIRMRRAPEVVIAMLGVLKAGGVYVPLDPEYPARRLAWMLEDASVAVLLTDAASHAEFPAPGVPVLRLDVDWPAIAEESVERLAGPAVDPAQVAYVIYTSGSTGRPKAVMTPHRAVSNYLQMTQREFPLGAGDRVLQLAAISFDASVSEIFTPLIAGAQLVLAAPDEQRDPARVVARLAGDRITVLQLVPSLLQFLIQDPGFARCAALRMIYCGGEAMTAELMTAVLARLPVTLINCYGPTEATIDPARLVCGHTAERGVVSVGRAMPNLKIHVLDERMRPVPIGVPGEAYFGGAGVARGYLGRPELTAEKFVPDPFAAEPGARLYRSGDLLRFRDDGNLEFLGRIDHQVKIRGLRVELGEIESQLVALGGVGTAAVVVRDDPPARQQLVAYVVPAPGRAIDEPALRARLAEVLPDYMVPSAFVSLDELPRSPNGKLDRAQLPAPWRAPAARRDAPRGATEEIVAGLFAQVLGHAVVGASGDFFELGGHSLLATQLTAQIREIFGVELPLRALFAERTVENIARAITAGRGARAELLRPVEAIASGERYPQSPAQRRLWFLDQLEPGSPVYLIPAALRLRGELSVVALERTLARLVARHPSLRTAFGVEDGEPVQRVLPHVAVALPVIDLTSYTGDAQAGELARRVSAEASAPFSLGDAPLLRAALLRLGPADHALVIAMHHIISDGRSLEVLLRDLEALYRAELSGAADPPAALPPPAGHSYVDYTAWHAALLREVAGAQLAYWRDQLAGLPATLALATDRPPPAVRSSRGELVRFALPDPAALAALARGEGASLFMVLLAGFDLLLHRWSGAVDLAVGTPVANRPRRELEDIVGFFVNTLVLRTRIDSRASARALIRQVRDTALDAYAHQDVPFERVVEELNPRRQLGHTPLFQVMFALEDAAEDHVQLPGLAVEALRVDREVAHFDLTLTVTRKAGRLDAALEFATDLFDRPRIERMAEHLVAIYEALVRDPDAPVHRAAALPAGQAQRLLARAGAADLGARFTPLHARIAERAAVAPDAIAIRHAGTTRSQARLDDDARRWHARLRAGGVTGGDRVAVVVAPALELPGVWLGIWRAGAVVAPLDPDEPALRLARMLDAVAPAAVITTPALRGRLPEGRWRCFEIQDDASDAAAPAAACGAAPAALAAVVFAPGPDGRPAPVGVTHAALIHACPAVFAPLRALADGVAVAIERGERAGGEPDGGAAGRAPGGIDAAGAGADLVAGAPGLVRYVLDDDGELAPDGAVGALWLGGPAVPCVALDRAAPVIADPRDPALPLHPTGERVRWLGDRLVRAPHGDRSLVLPGGARIALAEIEAAVVEHPRVARAAVVAMPAAWHGAGDPPRTWGHVMLAPGKSLTVDALLAHLRPRLPAAAIPAGFTFFPHGQRDLRQLGPPDAAHARPVAVPPRNDVEARLVALWQDLLGASAVGVHDDFFELGGHSILATQLASRIRAQWGVELAVRTLFERPTVAGVAAAIAALTASGADPGIVPAAPGPARSPDDDLLARIDELSDDELDRALAHANDDSE